MRDMRTPIIAAAGLMIVGGFGTARAQAVMEGNVHAWWHERFQDRPVRSPDAKKLPRIAVAGNKFVDPEGKPVLFRGLAIPDPDKLEAQGHWNRDYFVKVKEMGAGVVRIPVHPVAWRERTPAKYLTLLDQAVAWSTELGMYVLIDWHSIGNLKTEQFQDSMYDTTLKETFGFWRIIADHFAGHNTVAFYELFNEPTLNFDRLGPMSWDEWKRINEDLIILIRAYDKEVIPLVAGLDWAYDLTPLRINPVAAERIGYTTHPYAHKRPKPWEPKWEEDFAFAAERYPVLATEFGFNAGRGPADYGPTIVKFLESRGIGWICWVFDPEWGPSLIARWDPFTLTGSGEFFKQALHGTLPQAGAERR
jgi:endoglucanase